MPPVEAMIPAARRATRMGVGGRRYIGPKAQTTVEEMFWQRVEGEAAREGCAMSDIWREVIYAGLLATKRATRAEVREASASFAAGGE